MDKHERENDDFDIEDSEWTETPDFDFSPLPDVDEDKDVEDLNLPSTPMLPTRQS